MPRPAFPRSIPEFYAMFPDEVAPLGHIFESRWPGGGRCPKCGHGRACGRASRCMRPRSWARASRRPANAPSGARFRDGARQSRPRTHRAICRA